MLTLPTGMEMALRCDHYPGRTDMTGKIIEIQYNTIGITEETLDLSFTKHWDEGTLNDKWNKRTNKWKSGLRGNCDKIWLTKF